MTTTNRPEPDGQAWIVFAPRDPKAGDTVHYAELGEPIPGERTELNIQQTTVRRGSTNGNARGSSSDRRARRAWMMGCYASNIPGFIRCYRCGCLLFNPDDHPDAPEGSVFHEERHPKYGALLKLEPAEPITVDRIIPGVQGGTYRRNNIRPACAGCNSETGGALSRLPGKRKK